MNPLAEVMRLLYVALTTGTDADLLQEIGAAETRLLAVIGRLPPGAALTDEPGEDWTTCRNDLRMAILLVEFTRRLRQVFMQVEAIPPSAMSFARNPGAGDDVADGAYRGLVWVNTNTNQAFVCLNPAAGGAVWKQITT